VCQEWQILKWQTFDEKTGFSTWNERGKDNHSFFLTPKEKKNFSDAQFRESDETSNEKILIPLFDCFYTSGPMV
jgi:hypothetical protein